MPKFALANWLYYGSDALPGDIAKDFRDSSVFEKKIIARARANSVCCRFNTRGQSEGTVAGVSGTALENARKGVKGNIMVVPLDVIKMSQLIPPSAEEIRDSLCTVFVSDTMPSRQTIARLAPILVRRSRVKRLIKFLLASNAHYSRLNDLQFSDANLNALIPLSVDEGTPSAVHVGHVPLNDAIDGATSGYAPRYNVSTVGNEWDLQDLLMENVGYTDGDDSPVSYYKMKEIALERCLQGKEFIVAGSGTELVPDFHNPSLMTWLFPHLDPYGVGGFHHPGRVGRLQLSMEEQLKYLLTVDESPFMADPEFAFLYYNVLRKKNLSNTVRFSVSETMKKSIVRNMTSLDPTLLLELNKKCRDDPKYKPATEEEKKAYKILSSLRMVARHVPGSDGYKTMLQNEIKALIMSTGTPTLFVTLNPSDVDNPIVRLLIGGDIDLEDTARGEDMASWSRKLLAAKNPAACARFFDLTITNFIKIILRYGRDAGIYGTCKAYYGTVEAQGKGTLHCHMLIWLEGHASPQDLRDNIAESTEYRDKLFSWLQEAVMTGFPSVVDTHVNDTVQMDRMSRVKHSDNGNAHPGTMTGPKLAINADDFWTDFVEDVTALLYEYNWHEHQPTCWKYLKRGQEKCDKNCRMGMDGKTEPTFRVDPESSAIILQRLHPKLASFTALVLFLLRCNMDVKFVGSGEAAKAFLYYVTDYITKASLPLHVGMAALSYALKKICTPAEDGTPIKTTSAVVTAVNSMMGRQEISQPQVMSYLVGGGDHYTSEHFVVLQWHAMVKYMDKHNEPHNISSTDTAMVNIEGGASEMTVSNQQLDYSWRSDHIDFESLNLYNFVALAVKKPIGTKEVNDLRGLITGSQHPQYSTHYFTLRQEGKIPVLLGPSIPNADACEEARDTWSKYILILFKPWRQFDDIKMLDQSWTDAYALFEPSLSARDREVIKNMGVLRECSDAREFHRPRAGVDDSTDILHQVTGDMYPVDLDPQDYGMICGELNSGPTVSTGSVEDLLGSATADLLNLCIPQGDHGEDTSVHFAQSATLLTEQSSESINKHRSLMVAKRKRKDNAEAEEKTDSPKSKKRKISESIIDGPFATTATLGPEKPGMPRAVIEGNIVAVIQEMNLLENAEQLKAFRIVADHLKSGNTEQLLMHVSGDGGTGKSHVINALVKLFIRLKRRQQIRLGAPTGIAASLIGGQTLHSLIMCSPNKKAKNPEQLIAKWKGVSYLIIDEVSMIGARFLSTFSTRLREAKGDVPIMRDKPYGGVNVIFFGDFAQLKPPAQAALYAHELVKNASFSEIRSAEGTNSMNGAFLWRQVKTVVNLKKNMRHANDPVYGSFLQRLRVGKCADYVPETGMSDLDYIKQRTLSNIVLSPEAIFMTDFADAPVIVGTKAIRDAVNAKFIDYHSRRLNSEVETYYSSDTKPSSVIDPPTRNRLWDLPSSVNDDAQGKLQLFVGIKVMVTDNIAFDNGVVNGSEGIVTEIKYEVVDGRRYATVVYVRIIGSDFGFPDLDRDVVPIFPISTTIAHAPLQNTSLNSTTFRRRQLPLVPSYAYTDFKSQGRTLPRALVDIASARGQGPYVMLSRVKRKDGVGILRWFQPAKINGNLSEELRDELSRLAALADE